MARGAGLVQAADGRGQRRLVQQLGALLDLFGDGEHRVGEGVERLLALGLRGLDHQRAADHQRKVDRRRVEAVVQQPLGNVQGLDAAVVERAVREDALVQARLALGQVIGRLQPRAQIVGVQNRHARGAAQPVASHAQDVGIGPHQHAEVAGEGPHAADRRGCCRAPRIAGAAAHDARPGQVRH